MKRDIAISPIVLFKSFFASLFLLMTFSIQSQGSLVDDQMISPSLDSAHIPLKIYLPPGHSPNDTTYRVYIFLHGGLNSSHLSHLSVMKPLLDNLIDNNVIDPFVVVWPYVRRPGVINPDGNLVSLGNRHYYTDSYRSGNYESVIDKDLISWLNSQENIDTYGFSQKHTERAIGGFSMGGRASIRIAATNLNQFIAAASHCGVPALRVNESFFLPYLLSEYSGPPYNWNYSNGLESAYWFTSSIAFSPDTINPNIPDWKINFPVDSGTGTIIPAVFNDIWISKYDCSKLLNDIKIPDQNQKFKLPIGIYFDSRTNDPNITCSSLFNTELQENDIVGYGYNIFNAGGHALKADAVQASLIYIDNIMDSVASTSPVHEPAKKNSYLFELQELYPNPITDFLNISFKLNKNAKIYISLSDISGKMVKPLFTKKDLSKGKHQNSFDLRDLSSGNYILNINSQNENLLRQLVIKQ